MKTLFSWLWRKRNARRKRTGPTLLTLHIHMFNTTRYPK